MNIYQKNRKIGVIQREFIGLETGGFQTKENITMQINTLGTTQLLHIENETYLNEDMSLSSFEFNLGSSLFRFNARGLVTGDKLVVLSGIPSSQHRSEIPIEDIPFISGNIYEAAFVFGLEKDSARDFNIFDPSTLGIRSVKVFREADEVIPIMGRRVLTQKFCVDFMGIKNCAWLSTDGEVLKETGFMGLSMEKVSAEKAKEGISVDASVDFARLASIPSNTRLDRPEKLTQLKIKIDGISEQHFALHGGRQRFSEGILTVTKEKLPPDESVQEASGAIKHFLLSSPLVQSDHALIKAQANKIIHPGDTPRQKMQKVVAWVYKNIEKIPVISVPNALEVLRNKVGDCNEHAVLTAALLRAAGIPAQIETGLVYQDGRFYYHAWNTAYAGKWVSADSVFNQIPADVTHLRLVRGEGSEQLDLLGVIGRIELEVLSTKYD